MAGSQWILLTEVQSREEDTVFHVTNDAFIFLEIFFGYIEATFSKRKKNKHAMNLVNEPAFCQQLPSNKQIQVAI